jgi:hypothetical protein
MFKTLETLGTILAVAGSFLVAMNIRNIGYPLFFASSVLMLASAVGQKQRNFIVLQGTFLCANIVGLFN